MSDYIQLRQQNFSFLGKECHLNGIYRFKGTTRFACSLEGELMMDDQATLTIEREGKFTGIIECHDLEVFGEIQGEVRAQGLVTLFSSAKFSGKMTALGLKIYPGAEVNMDGHTLEVIAPHEALQP